MAQFKATEEFNRLDKVVIKHYGDLSMFDDVVNANPHITSTILVVGDDVFLPVIEVKKVEEKLW